MDIAYNNFESTTYYAPTTPPQYNAPSYRQTAVKTPVYIAPVIETEQPKRINDGRTDIIVVGKKPHLNDLLIKRVASGAKGKNWLFVEHPNFPTDKAFQAQLRQYQNDGIVNRLDVIFPTRTAQNDNLETRLLAKSQTVFEWLEGGAEFLVYGNKKNGLANDIAAVLAKIVAEQTHVSGEKADVYIADLKREKRFIEEEIDLELGTY